MQARERIIRDRFTEQVCGQCRAHYTADSVVVLAHRRSVWMVMAACPSCQGRALFVVSFHDGQRPSDALLDTPQFFPNSFLPATPPDAPSATKQAIPEFIPPLENPARRVQVTIADVNAMHEFLQRFDGDFRSLFTPPSPRGDDTAS